MSDNSAARQTLRIQPLLLLLPLPSRAHCNREAWEAAPPPPDCGILLHLPDEVPTGLQRVAPSRVAVIQSRVWPCLFLSSLAWAGRELKHLQADPVGEKMLLML